MKLKKILFLALSILVIGMSILPNDIVPWPWG